MKKKIKTFESVHEGSMTARNFYQDGNVSMSYTAAFGLEVEIGKSRYRMVFPYTSWHDFMNNILTLKELIDSAKPVLSRFRRFRGGTGMPMSFPKDLHEISKGIENGNLKLNELIEKKYVSLKDLKLVDKEEPFGKPFFFNLGLINFRKFHEQEFKFSPITILTGANSSGKSTVFKAITACQESNKFPFYLQPTFADHFNNLINRNSRKKETRITFNEISLNYIMSNNMNEDGFLKYLRFKDVGFSFVETAGHPVLTQIVFEQNKEDFLSQIEQQLEKAFKIDIRSERIDQLEQSIQESSSRIEEEKKIIRESIARDKKEKQELERKLILSKNTNNIIKFGNPEPKQIIAYQNNIIKEITRLQEEIKRWQSDKSIILQTYQSQRDSYKYTYDVQMRWQEKWKSLIENVLTQMTNRVNPKISGIDIVNNGVVLSNINITISENMKLDSILEHCFEKIDEQVWESVRSNNKELIKNIEQDYKKASAQQIKSGSKRSAQKQQQDMRIRNSFLRRALNHPNISIFSRHRQRYIMESLEKFVDDIRNKIISLQAVRASQKRSYLDSDPFGEILYEYQTKSANFSDDIKSFLKKWLLEFKMGDDISIERNLRGSSVILKRGKKKINLVDLGYGYTELLPIILTIALAKYQEVELILLEEPECNLHPNFQTKIANLIADASKRFGIQFIIETHSEYLIRGTQLLVQEQKNLYNEKIKIYYFTNENTDDSPLTVFEDNSEQNRVYEINYSDKGLLDNKFRDGFLNEAFLIDSKFQKGLE